ncbi:MAG: hypothetical protein K8R92_06620 [Planctomycetes bacterium]|nr:hypothetical protein [Planctomycetota bacterium]
MIRSLSIISILVACAIAFNNDAWAQPQGQSSAPANATSAAQAPADPFMVVGEVVTRTYALKVKTGPVVSLWRPPSANDYRAYVTAIQVPAEYRPSFDELFVESAVADQKLIDDSAPGMGPPMRKQITPDMTDAQKAAIYAPDPPGVQLAMRQAVHQFLIARDKAERDTLDKIDARCGELGITLDPAARESARRSFEAARWRARCSDVSYPVTACMIDIGLLAMPVIDSMKEGGDPAKRVLQQYWREITPTSKEAVELNSLMSMEILSLRDKLEKGGDKATLGAEIRKCEMRKGAPLFQRAEANFKWLPMIAAALPEAERRDYIEKARDLMFPQVPSEKGVGQDAVRFAVNLPSVGEAEKAKIAALGRERSDAIGALDQKFDALLMTYWRSQFSGGNKQEFEKGKAEYKELLVQREKLEEKTYNAVRGILTAEQAANFPEYKPLKIPSNPFTARPLPAPPS